VLRSSAGYAKRESRSIWNHGECSEILNEDTVIVSTAAAGTPASAPATAGAVALAAAFVLAGSAYQEDGGAGD
jgi:hypothetical protein